jgi:hypothetical protein
LLVALQATFAVMVKAAQDGMLANAAPRQLPRWLAELVFLLALLAITVALFQSLDGTYDLDCDDTNLALAISRFDITSFQPHPPGYLGYVALLKAVHAVTGANPTLVTRLVSRLFAILAVLLTWRAVLRLSHVAWGAGRLCRPRTIAGGFGNPPWVPNANDRKAALLAAAFVAWHPILLYYGVDAQTHSAEMAMSALLLLALAHVLIRPTLARAAGIGLVLAAGGSFRPSYVLVSVGPVLWTYRRDLRGLLVIAAVSAFGTLAWLLPTLALTAGGLATYRAASDSLMGNFIRMVSPLSSSALPRFARDNVTSALAWTLLALMPALVALAVKARSWRTEITRWPVQALLAMALPAALFYCFVLCAEAGYLAGLVPPAAIVAATALSAETGAKPWQARGRYLLAVALLAVFLFAPGGQGLVTMMPTTSEVMARQARIDALYVHLLEDLPPGERILVVTDWPEPTALRQLPVLRPGSEVLQVPWRLRSDFQPVYSIALATDHDFTGLFPVPGQPPDFLRHRQTERTYDWIVVDPRTSDRVRDELRRHGSCPIPRLAEERPARLRPDCFPEHRLRMGEFSFQFGVRPE